MKEEGRKKEKIEWDKRKIALAVFVFFILLFAVFEVKSLMLDKNVAPANDVKQNFQGVPTFSNPANGVKNTIQQNIDSLKKDAANIDVAELATSSPQVQKLIRDLKDLQNYPSSGLKNACFKICNGI